MSSKLSKLTACTLPVHKEDSTSPFFSSVPMSQVTEIPDEPPTDVLESSRFNFHTLKASVGGGYVPKTDGDLPAGIFPICISSGGRDPSDSLAISTESLPISTVSLPISTGGFPISTESLPISTVSLPISTDNLPISTESLPISTNSLPISTDNLPISTESLLISTDSLLISTDSLPISTDSLPIATESFVSIFESSGTTLNLRSLQTFHFGKLPTSQFSDSLSSLVALTDEYTREDSCARNSRASSMDLAESGMSPERLLSNPGLAEYNLGLPAWGKGSGGVRSSGEASEKVKGRMLRSCMVCEELAHGRYFGALVCLPCKAKV
ncbi:hypothetical protein ACOMHN_043351 [Nucella lapillus]